MTYPFKNISLNRNRKIIAVANPSADIMQMVAKAVAGVADNYRGVWKTSGTYTNGEMVLYSNVMWLCLASTTTATPATGSAVWQAVGSYSAFLGTWSSSTAYVVGDEVTYNGNFYVCTAANTNQTPNPASSSYWQIAGPSNLDSIADGSTYARVNLSELTANKIDPSKAGNPNAQAQYLSSVTGAQANLIPDAGLKAAGIYWPDHSSGAIVVTQNIDGHNNCFEYYGTGSASGYLYRTSLPIPVNPGTTYTLSAVGLGSGITSGNAFLALYDTAITTRYGYFNITSASNGRLNTQITIPAGVTKVIALFDTNNCTVSSGGGLFAQQFQLEVGSTMTAFRENTGDNLSGTVGIDFSKAVHQNASVDYLGGVQGGTCYDGQSITFNPTYATPPVVLFSGGGMSYSSAAGSAVSQTQQFTASSLSTTGFTASLKLVTGGTLTARTDSFTTVTAGSEYKCTLTNAPAYNSQYTVNFTLSLGSASGGTVYIRETSNSGTILWSKAYVTAQNGSKAITVTWSGATGTSVIDLSLVLSEGTGTISATNVTFTSGTSPTSYSAVPSTAPIQWLAYPSS